MERFITTMAKRLDRRSWLRSFGKLGMGAAAVTGALLLSRKASAQVLCGNNGGQCAGTHEGERCGTQGGICTVENPVTKRCRCVHHKN